MRRVALALLGAVLLIAAAVAFTVQARQGSAQDEPPVERLTLAAGQLLVRDTVTGRVTSVSPTDPDGPRRSSGLKCDRFAAAKRTAVCLTARPGVLPAVTDVQVLDADLAVRHQESLPGTPSRARVSPDGGIVTWTLFVTGDSYAATGFSTRAGLYEVGTGSLVKTIEELPVFTGDRRYFAADVNYWGVTFAADGNRFYATLGSRGTTRLVEADYGRYQGKVLRENVECPSLSPDGKRIAFKKKVSEGVWRLAVLDLATLEERELAEHGNVDDQALWQDDSTVLYGLDNAVWAVPADGSGSPRLVARNASSPAATG